ncbi:MAG TPA: uroporphyrinogen decarboxylase family protein [Bacteroidota bacterium]|nr:uroporphyrinogen decarboxylase family protein [Bacteroidota bacterium]
MTARSRFIDYVRDPSGSPGVVSPFLPHRSVVSSALEALALPVSGDPVADEILLARELDYQPMFMTECSALIFNWRIDEPRSGPDRALRVIETPRGEWLRPSPRVEVPWSDQSECPVRTRDDHAMLRAACELVEAREGEIRGYFRRWRSAVGEDGVIVLGHPHPSWLGYQINPSAVFLQWNDWPDEYLRSMEAVCRASLVVMEAALAEGVDFMSDSSYGLEMTSPRLFAAMDLPWIRRFSSWTHERGGLFWYHNCGFTRRLILDGTFNALGADVIETVAPPPEGDNDLAESRRALDKRICSKGNLNLRLLRDDTPEGIEGAVRSMAGAVRGSAHIYSTADAVLEGTPAENFIAFVRASREAALTGEGDQA